MRSFLIPLTLLLTLTFANQSASALEQAEVDSVYIEALYAADDGDLDTATSLLETIKKPANDPYIYIKLSELYIKLQMYETARHRLSEGLGVFPGDAELNFSMAQLYLFHYRDAGMAEIFAADALKEERDIKYLYLMADLYKILNDEANLMRILDELIIEEPSARVLVERGNLYRNKGMLAEAERDYLKAYELDEDLGAAARLAEIHIEREGYEKAVKYLSILSEKRPDFVLSDLKLAEIYKRADNSTKALEIFKRILPKVEGREKIYVLRQIAGIYYSTDDYKNALVYFKQVAELAPNDVQVFYSMGVISEMENKFADAEKYYRKAIAVRPDYVEARKRIGFISLKDKKYDEGIKVITKIPADLRDVDYYRITGELYKEKGTLSKAYEVLRKGYEENPSSVELVIDFALVLEKQKKYDECFEVLKDALELNPGNPSLMNFLGYTYADLSIKLDEAYTLIESALAKDPENPAYLDSMAWVLYRFEKYEEAYGYQIRALRKAPDEKEIRDHMKAILERLEINKSVDDILKGK
jgi:tetratricopeptide (TPR) repeat protein